MKKDKDLVKNKNPNQKEFTWDEVWKGFENGTVGYNIEMIKKEENNTFSQLESIPDLKEYLLLAEMYDNMDIPIEVSYTNEQLRLQNTAYYLLGAGEELDIIKLLTGIDFGKDIQE